jgi:hypothetical protein
MLRRSASSSLGRIAGGFAWSPDGSRLYVSVRPAAEEAAHDNLHRVVARQRSHLRGTRIRNGCPENSAREKATGELLQDVSQPRQGPRL